jgi:ribulose-bisphosphate carboxylase small chain
MDRAPLMNTQQQSRSGVSSWVVGLGVASALCVAVAVATSPAVSPVSNYVATTQVAPATNVRTAATYRPRVQTARPASEFGAANFDAPMSAAAQYQGITQQPQEAAGPAWFASMLLLPLSALLGAVAYTMRTRNAKDLAPLGPVPAVSMAATSGKKEKEMKVWNPIDNKKFETFSYLPPLSDAAIAKQVDMVIAKNLAPCLEFSAAENAYVSSENCDRFSGSTAGYYDNRYWTMWKLPMFGCSDANQVLREIAECKQAYPQCYIRLAAFDSVKQVQVVSFVVHQPGAAVSSYSAPAAAAAPAPAVDAWNSWAVTGEKEMMEE